jgi:choline dehydrogenase-like flavoprotein
VSHPARVVQTEVAVIGSGAGGATTAAVLAEAGRAVTVLEEGPWVPPGEVEPFSLGEMERCYRHHGSSAAMGAPPVAYAEGRCVGGSTEVNSGLWHRVPEELTERWRTELDIDEFGPDVLDRYASTVESWQQVSTLPGPPPPSSEVLVRGAARLGWSAAELPRVYRYDEDGRATKQTMSRTQIPRAVAAGAEVLADCRVDHLDLRDGRVRSVECRATRPDGTVERLSVRAEQVVVCGGAIQTPALLQRSGLRRGIGTGLKLHPTIKVVARFPEALDHDDVPMHRVTEHTPGIALGGSASRAGHIGLALADGGAPPRGRPEGWEQMFVYYAAIRSDAGGRVTALPGLRAPLVTYRLTEGDLSRLARGLVHLGELLLAAGATELRPSVTGAPTARRVEDLAAWWPLVDRRRANLMTVHLTSTLRMGEDRARAGADSFGRIPGVANLRVNDASLLPDAPGVNPQAAIMAIAARNADHLLATS